jgi:hypothetical protein
MTKLCFLGERMDSHHAAARVFATLFIWAAVTILGIGTLVNSTFLGGGPVIIIMVLLVGAAATATQNVWRSDFGSRAAAEKIKRRTRVDRMMDKLSETEVEELRARLMAETDGEQVTLDELMTEHEKRRS